MGGILSKPRPKSRGRWWVRTSDYACQYLTHDSPIHRLGVGWKIAISFALSGLAVGVRTHAELLALVIVTLAYYFAAGLTAFDLWRDIRFFVFQAMVVIGLYCVLYGVEKGLWAGVRTSVQIILFYIPGAVLLRTTRTGDMMRGLRKVVPYRLTFLVFVSIRFVPFFLREMDEIMAAQRLRGARLHPRQLIDPRNWGDLFHCLILPLMVRALKTAEEVSLSAEAREFGSQQERTFFDSSCLETTESPALKESLVLPVGGFHHPCPQGTPRRKKGVT
jgi:energy-coupling factor transport system permease protein